MPAPGLTLILFMSFGHFRASAGTLRNDAPSTFCDILESWRKIPKTMKSSRTGRLVDPSHSLDMVTLYTSLAVDADMEADMIHGLLESNGVPSIVVHADQFPPLGYEVQVPRDRFDEARSLIAEAQAAGPDAAAEAEAAGKKAGRTGLPAL